MNERDISYALSKQVPDMSGRGFIIGTAYGELNIAPGPMATSISKHVGKLLERELRKLEKRAHAAGQLTQRDVKAVFSTLFG